MIYNIVFVALTPVETKCQADLDEDRNTALAVLHNELLGIYGPEKFKIIHFEEGPEIIPEIPTMEISSTHENSRMEH